MIESKKIRIIIIFLFFILAILFYDIFSTRAGFTDTGEYINLAKEFAGLNKTNLYVYHSLSYSLFLALFLKLFPLLLTLKIINSLFLVLDAFLLYKITNNKKVLLLWIFSPLVYYMTIFISPILASSFFLLFAYYFFKKYEDENKKVYFITSALSLGLVGVFRTPELVLVLFFVIIFFYNRTFKEFFYYSILTLIMFSFQLLIDYIVFGVPYYSLIIYFAGQTFSYLRPQFLRPIWLLSLFIMAPLTLLIFRSQDKKELVFVLLSYIYFSIMAHYRLLLVITPFVVLLLSKILSKKLIFVNSMVGVILIFSLTYGYFGNNDNNILKNDLINLEKDFEERIIVTSDGDAYFFPALYWNDFHYIWLRDYNLYKQNKTTYNTYGIRTYPRLRDAKIVEINVNLKQNRDPILQTINEKDTLFIFKKDEFEHDIDSNLLIVYLFKERIKLEGIELVKCYNRICVFKKK